MPRPEWIQAASLNRFHPKVFCWMGLTSKYFLFVFICFYLILTYLQEEQLKARMAELEAKLQAQAWGEIIILIFTGLQQRHNSHLFDFPNNIVCVCVAGALLKATKHILLNIVSDVCTRHKHRHFGLGASRLHKRKRLPKWRRLQKCKGLRKRKLQLQLKAVGLAAFSNDWDGTKN